MILDSWLTDGKTRLDEEAIYLRNSTRLRNNNLFNINLWAMNTQFISLKQKFPDTLRLDGYESYKI